MNQMKVCKLVSLTKKDQKGNFVNSKEGMIVRRNKVVIPAEDVEAAEENFETTGLLYIVDEKATAARNKIVEKEIEAAKSGVIGLPALDVEADKETGAEKDFGEAAKQSTKL